MNADGTTPCCKMNTSLNADGTTPCCNDWLNSSTMGITVVWHILLQSYLNLFTCSCRVLCHVLLFTHEHVEQKCEIHVRACYLEREKIHVYFTCGVPRVKLHRGNSVLFHVWYTKPSTRDSNNDYLKCNVSRVILHSWTWYSVMCIPRVFENVDLVSYSPRAAGLLHVDAYT